jgi:hypothetical protein
MYESSLVRDRAITPHEDVISDRLSEYLYLQDVRNDLLGFAINVWMYEGDVVVTCDDIPEGRQSLLYPLDGN